MTPAPYLTPSKAAWFLYQCVVAAPAIYFGGKALGTVLGYASTNPVRWRL